MTPRLLNIQALEIYQKILLQDFLIHKHSYDIRDSFFSAVAFINAKENYVKRGMEMHTNSPYTSKLHHIRHSTRKYKAKAL